MQGAPEGSIGMPPRRLARRRRCSEVASRLADRLAALYTSVVVMWIVLHGEDRTAREDRGKHYGL